MIAILITIAKLITILMITIAIILALLGLGGTTYLMPLV